MPMQQESSRYHQTREQLLSEAQIIEQVKKKPERFEVLYNKYYEQIFRYIFQRIGDRDQTFDVTSQVFLKAMVNIKKYEFRGVPFSSWLYRIAYSELNNQLRENNVQRSINVKSEDIRDIAEEMEESDLAQYEDQLMEAIAELPEMEMQLIEMRYFEKRSFKEIAEILDLTVTNAKVKVYRTLNKLKSLLLINK